MNSEWQRELDREQWRDLVRGLCLVQAGGYPGAVSISKRFLQSPPHEVEDMARIARHMVQEYGLVASLEVNGTGIALRIQKAEAAPQQEAPLRAPVETELEPVLATPQSSRRAPFLRLLEIVHIQTRADA